MVRELSRFIAEDDAGRVYKISEIAAFQHVAGSQVMEGVPTFLTETGLEVVPTYKPGEYRIPNLRKTVREAAGSRRSGPHAPRIRSVIQFENFSS